MRLRLVFFSGLAAIWPALAAFLLLSCSTLERRVVAPPEIDGATFVGNNACAECHANYTQIFGSSPHGRIYSPTSQFSGNAGCESCHGAGSKHVAAGGGREKFIINPGRSADACYTCHLESRAQFNLPQHHPVPEGKMNCMHCHDLHGFDIHKPAKGLAMARVNDQCVGCHRDQGRRFVFEHEAVREGCTTCHQPHGSINGKMLVRPDANLCLRCHAQVQGVGISRGTLVIGTVDHSRLVSRGACWTSGCHTAVHGSNVDRTLRY